MSSSDPLLAPIPLPPVTRPGAPLTELALANPRGAAVANVMLLVLAAWAFASPSILGYAHHAQATSDRVSAVLVAAFALASLIARRPWLAWVAGGVGLWMIVAPVLLWSPSGGAYLSSTLAGTLIASEGLLVPMNRRLPGPAIPPGWSYDPSSWAQRLPVILLAAGSYVIAGYLAAYQLGYLDRVWDPVFGTGTERVLDSAIARAWPVSDAALGAAAYLIAFVLACTGATRRWRTLPWVVLAFGALLGVLGVVSIVNVILQPAAIGAWCSWCVLLALATLSMISLSLDEVGATVHRLRAVRRAGGSWWSALWRGTHDDGRGEPPAQSEPATASAPSRSGGVTP